MQDKFEKTPEQIKKQLETYFVKYHCKNKTDFTGDEDFTLFELMNPKKQQYFLKRIELNHQELCVLVLNCGQYGQIINSTERFIKINENFDTECIAYTDFIGHHGYEKKFNLAAQVTVKKDGYFEKFVLRKRNGETVFWTIPTGRAGFAFWNVTKKCSFIGTKYNLKNNTFAKFIICSKTDKIVAVYCVFQISIYKI